MSTGFVEKLIQLRKEKGISQKKLGMLTGIAQTTISEWERGNSQPDIEQANMLARSLGTTLVDILNDKSTNDKTGTSYRRSGMSDRPTR